jgi:NADPH2:quinone reductase
MRAWQTIGAGAPHDVLRLEGDAVAPESSAGMLRVAVVAAGIGLPDALMCRGSYALTPAKRPFTQGQEVVGRVVDWGEGVLGFEVGERVMGVTGFVGGDGGFAEECLVYADFCLPVPDAMSDAEAACFTIPFHTAYIALVARGRLEAGETLLVLGAAGGTGQAAVQLGKALGARVIAVAGGPEKGAFCAELGADVVIDHCAQSIDEAVLAATFGAGADAVYDPVGGEAFAAATRCVAHEGRILAVGFASGAFGTTNTEHLVYNNYSVMGVIPSRYDRAFKERAHLELMRWYEGGQLRPRVAEVVPFEALPGALERLLDRGVLGKLCLAVAPDAMRA